jgi:hypothetical protein
MRFTFNIRINIFKKQQAPGLILKSLLWLLKASSALTNKAG